MKDNDARCTGCECWQWPPFFANVVKTPFDPRNLAPQFEDNIGKLAANRNEFFWNISVARTISVATG